MARPKGTRAAVTGLVAIVVVVALVASGVGLFRWVTTLWVQPPSAPIVRCQALVNSSTADLTQEQARNSSIIAGVAAQRGLVPRAVSIALATAFQESGIRNLDYGDRDSLGIFQQRPSMGWGTAQQVMDPYYATGKFFDVMVTVDGWQSADIGTVAQTVQRSGFPDAYDQHVDQARLLASALSGETPAAWSCVVRNPSGPDPDQLLQALTQAYGPTIQAESTPATPDQPASITLTANTDTIAWSTAAFAQSWASQTGVSAVSVGQFSWLASPTVLSGWIGTPESTQTSTTVVISF
ncbi:MAG: hypothetical protein FWF43_04550 [Propionibacteriaceae bacterium]|nr:hypothetical protein [Propionibacteriaceae bacterium]